MKKLFSILFLTLLLGISLFAQNNSGKCAFVISEDFDNKETGIIELTQAYDKLQAEFEPKNHEIQALIESYQKLGKEIESFQKLVKEHPGGDYMSFDKKIDEYQKLEDKIIITQQRAKSSYERRVTEEIRPIIDKINKSLKEFAKQRGYETVIDKSTIKESAFTVYPPDGVDLTKEFIRFYNAGKRNSIH